MRYLPVAAMMLIFHAVALVHGAPVTFTDESAFLTATGATTMESFETLDPIPGTIDPISTDHFVITITPISPVAVMNIEEGYDNGLHPTDGNRYFAAGALGLNDGACILTFTFPTPVTSFGMTVTDFGDNNLSGSLILGVNGESFTIATIPPMLDEANEIFFGVQDQDNPFSVVTITKATTQDRLGIDEVRFASVNSVPEPSAIVLFVAGLTTLLGGCLLRRKRVRL